MGVVISVKKVNSILNYACSVSQAIKDGRIKGHIILRLGKKKQEIFKRVKSQYMFCLWLISPISKILAHIMLPRLLSVKLQTQYCSRAWCEYKTLFIGIPYLPTSQNFWAKEYWQETFFSQKSFQISGLYCLLLEN